MSNDTRLERVEDKIDKIGDRLGSIDSTLAAQHESLKQHMKRTDLLEAQLEPLKRHVAMVEGITRALGGLAVVAAVLEAIVQLLEYTKK